MGIIENKLVPFVVLLLRALEIYFQVPLDCVIIHMVIVNLVV